MRNEAATTTVTAPIGTTGRRRHAGAAFATVAVLAFGGSLAACGSSSSSGTTTTTGSTGSSTSSVDVNALVTSSVKAMKGLSSLRAVGSIVSSGTNMTIDWTLTRTVSSGTFATSKGSFQIVTSGSTVYMQADQPFWQSQGVPAATAQLMGGKWITGLPASDTSSITGSFSLSQLLGSLDQAGSVTSAGTSTVGGQQAIGVKSSSDGSVAYIAATGTPYLLQIVSPNNGAQGRITFSEFGTAPTPTIPANPVDFSTLGG
jgi:hypothetical protein